MSDKTPPALVELIQFYALRQDPLTLTIESKSCQRGWIAVLDGDVVKAWTAGGKQSIEAFVEIVSWDGPSVVQKETVEVDDFNIDLPLPQLLLETFWKAQEHEPTDPRQERIPTGLEEDTVAGSTEFGPPDGVTKAVLETAQWFSEVTGFVAVALISAVSGAHVETLGKRSLLTIEPWFSALVIGVSDDDTFEQAVFLNEQFIDVLLPPFNDEQICYLLRMDRSLTNRGLVEVALQTARKPNRLRRSE